MANTGDVFSLNFSSYSDIELAVMVAKQIELIIVTHFLPSPTKKGLPIGQKVKLSTLNKDLKTIIVKNILYQRNDLVHTPFVNHFKTKEMREKFVHLSKEVLSELERLSELEGVEVVQCDGDIPTRSAATRSSMTSLSSTLSSLSEDLIESSLSLQTIISEDSDNMLCYSEYCRNDEV